MTATDQPNWWPGIWFYGPKPFYGFRGNVLPWFGSDGDETWCRRTVVVPLLGLGAIIIGLRWHLLAECMAEWGDAE